MESVRGVCVTAMTTQISINVNKKVLTSGDHSLSGFVCQRVAGGGSKKKIFLYY